MTSDGLEVSVAALLDLTSNLLRSKVRESIVLQSLTACCTPVEYYS
jgi:hypothetical protein